MRSFQHLADHLDTRGQYDLADRIDRVAQQYPLDINGEPMVPLRKLPQRDEATVDDDYVHDYRPEPGPYRVPGSDFDPSTVELMCPEPGCGGRLMLKPSKYGPFWGCERWSTTGCNGSVSAHKADGRPMGTPVTADVKKVRRAAHEAFDKMWNSPDSPTTRDKAYQWLQRAMGMTPEQAHIGQFGIPECEKLLSLVGPAIQQMRMDKAARSMELRRMSPKERELEHERDVVEKHMGRLYSGPKAIMSKDDAYSFMMDKLGLTPEQTDLRTLDRSQCRKMIGYIGALRKERGQT